MNPSLEKTSEDIRNTLPKVAALRDQINRVLVGQSYMVDRLLIGLFAGGHVLIEGLPGLAKTTAIKTLAQCINASFSRVQFTPDLLPADVVGTLIYNPAQAAFSVKKGPIFANLVLADEINRAPAKVQSALLEAMQEHQVTIGSETFKLESPFLVMATQNPIEQQGTYPLPEAQVDRFMLKLQIGYPSMQEELEIMNRNMCEGNITVSPVISIEEVKHLRSIVDAIYLDEKIKNYIITIVAASRKPQDFNLQKIKDYVAYGASPRASIWLARAAKAYAFLQGRAYVTPHDIKAMAPDVLRHRIIVSYEAEAEEYTSNDVIKDILDNIDVP